MEDLFGAPTEAAPPPSTGEDGGFTLLGDTGDTAPAAATGDATAYVGDVQEQGTDSDPMGFASAPTAAVDDDDFFGAAAPPPTETVSAEDTPIILAPPPPVDDGAPIVLGPPPVAEGDAADTDPGTGAAVIVEDAEDDGRPASTRPGHMQKFNQEFQETLKQRMAEEDAAKAEMEAAAKAAVDSFIAKREAKLEARLSKNREDEQAKLEDIEADLENDNSWQRVNKLVDLTVDGNNNLDDTTRMRDVFIMLKNEDGLSAKVGA